jgi:RNA 2',3'-cyclic 3'-phosphodiesterase
MHRLFVGLRPPAPVRAHLHVAMAGVPGARWQDDEQLHLTLRFIGEVDGAAAEDIAAGLSQVTASLPPLTVAGIGRFDVRGRVTTLWAGVSPREPLAALHRKVDAALVRAGQAPERRSFLPHITLARLNAPEEAVRPWLAEHAGLACPPFAADHLLLFESHLGRAGATYEAVARYPLC